MRSPPFFGGDYFHFQLLVIVLSRQKWYNHSAVKEGKIFPEKLQAAFAHKKKEKRAAYPSDMSQVCFTDMRYGKKNV